MSGNGKARPSKVGTELPLTKQLSRADLTQAIPDAEDLIPGYLPGSLHKRMPAATNDSSN